MESQRVNRVRHIGALNSGMTIPGNTKALPGSQG
jgi:hypothetical protein